jgi:hypothetical protein
MSTTPMTEHLDDAGTRLHAARVKLLQAGMAARILAIPADVSPHARKLRITKSWQQGCNFIDRICTTYVAGRDGDATITNRRQWDLWWKALYQADQAIKAALSAGDDLGRFMFPSGEAA